MKFNVGDIIKGGQRSGYHYSMTDERMTKAVVTKVYEDKTKDIEIKVLEHDNKQYIGEKYQVCSAYFDLVKCKKEKSRKPIVIYNRDKEVIAVDKNTGKKAIARCCTEDTFDFETGAKIAFERLLSDPDDIAIGDTVRVINTGALYTTNVDKVIEMTNNKKVLARYAYGDSKGFEPGKENTIIGTYRVLDVDDEKLLIQKNDAFNNSSKYGEVLLINKRGVKKC